MTRNDAAQDRADGPFASMAPLVRRMGGSELEESLALFNRALGRHPARACLLNLRGLALLGLARLDEALAAFRTLAAEYPDRAEGHEGLTETLCRAGRWEPCLAASREALSRNPARAETLEAQGEALMNLARYEEAAETYAALKRAHPRLPLGYDGLARALYRLDRHELSLAACELALGRFPGRPNMQNLRGMALLALSRFGEAAALYAALRDDHPDLPWGHDGLAEALLRQGRREESLEAFDLALERFPGRPEILALKGRALLGLSRLDEAAGLFAGLVAQHPDLPLGHDGLVEATFRQRRWEDCLAACTQALARFPGRVANLDCLGYALMRLYRFADMKRWLEEHFARSGVGRLPLATRAFFDAHPLVTPYLAGLYAKACLACGESERAAALLDDMHHYAQEGAAKDALFGEYAALLPHFGNAVLGVSL